MLEFDETNHIFTLDGRRIASVTQVLSHFIPHWNCDPWYLERGKVVHKATELYDKGTLDSDSVDPQIQGYLQGWEKFRFDYEFVPTHIEFKTYHKIYQYAGIIDRIGNSRIGNFLLDIKSGEPTKSDKLQIAGGYLGMMPEAKNCMALYLREDGTYRALAFSPGEIREAKNAWLSMVTTFNYLMKEGLISW